MSAPLSDAQRDAAEAALLAHERLLRSLEPRYRRSGLDPDDVLQELRIGFAGGTVRYDPARGALGPYCSRRARAATVRAIHDTGSTVRVPPWLRVRLRQVRRGQVPEDERTRRAQAALYALSLDEPVAVDDADETHGSLLPSADPSPEDRTGDAMLRRVMLAAMGNLTSYERQVIELHYLADPPLEPKEIATTLGRTHDSVRSTERHALAKLEAAVRRRLGAEELRVLGVSCERIGKSR